jgi:glycosyltransferase involved in cell wall biosynthesis
MESELNDRIHLLGLQGIVRLAGFHADWRELAAQSDVYLQPSIREGACLAALEAMQHGLPVIATPTGGLIDYARAGDCVWLTSGFAVTDIAASITAVLSQPAKRESLSKAGAAYLQEEYSPAAVRDLYNVAAQGIGI